MRKNDKKQRRDRNDSGRKGLYQRLPDINR